MHTGRAEKGPPGAAGRPVRPYPEPPAAGFPPPPQRRDAIREWDRRAIEQYGIAGLVLMENAGRGAALIVRELLETGAEGLREDRLREDRLREDGLREDGLREPVLRQGGLREPVHILCGPGNNGGDGFVVARNLHGAGVAVRVHVPRGTEYRAGSDAATNLAILVRLGVRPVEMDGPADLPARAGTFVDALFGTGLARPLGSPHREIVEALNRSGAPAVSLDIPSGLDADTGEVLGAAVRACHTITFAAEKLGFGLGSGPAFTGRIHVVDIGLPRALWAPALGAPG